MSSSQRIANVILGLFTILLGVIMIIPDDGNYLIVLLLLELSLFFTGIRQLFYYFTMAKYMVGGIYIFFKGLFLLDAGLFAMNMDHVPRQYAMIYLIIGMAFSGAVAILRALETKRMRSAKWKYPVFIGVVEILISVVCLFFLNDPNILSIVYSVGLIHSGGARIITSLQPSAIVYIK